MKRWVVSGYKGDNEFFRDTFSENGCTEADITTLMQRLCSKFLTALQVVECTPGYLGRSGALDAKIDVSGDKRIITVATDDIRFTAILLESIEIKEVRRTTFSVPETAPWRTL